MGLQLEASVSNRDEGEQAVRHGHAGALASVMEGDEEIADAQDISKSPGHQAPSPCLVPMQGFSPTLASPCPETMLETSPTLASSGTRTSPRTAELSPPHDGGFLPAEQCVSPTRDVPQCVSPTRDGPPATRPEAGPGAPACVSEPGFAPPAWMRRTPRRLVLDRGESGCSKSVAELVVHFSPKPAATPKPTPKHCITPKKHAKSLFWEGIAEQEAEKALASPSKSSPSKPSPLKVYPTLGSPGSRGGSGLVMGSPNSRGEDGSAMGSPTSRGMRGSPSASGNSNPLAGAIWAVCELAAAPLPAGHRFESLPTSSPVKSSPFLLTSSLASPIFPKSPGAFGNPRVSTPTLHVSMPPANVPKETPQSPFADAPMHMQKETPKSPVVEERMQQNSHTQSARTPMQSLSQSYPNPVIPMSAMEDCTASATPFAGPRVGGVAQSPTHFRLGNVRKLPDQMRKPSPDLGAVEENRLPVDMGHSCGDRADSVLENMDGTLRMSRVPQLRVGGTPVTPNLQLQEEHSWGPALSRTQGEAGGEAGAAISAGARLVLPGETSVLPVGAKSPTNSSWTTRIPLSPQGSQTGPQKLAEAVQQAPRIDTANASPAVRLLQQTRDAVPAEAPSLVPQDGSRGAGLGPGGDTAEGGAASGCSAGAGVEKGGPGMQGQICWLEHVFVGYL